MSPGSAEKRRDDNAARQVHEPHLDRAEISRRAGRGVLLIGLRGLAVRFLALAGNIVLARLLSPHDFGALAFGFTILNFASVLTSGGLGAALVRSERPPTTADLQALFGFHIGVFGALAALIVGIGVFSGEPGLLAAIMAISLPIDAARIPSAVMAERALDFGVIARAEVIETAVYNVAAIAAVAAGLGIWGVAAVANLRALAGSAVLVLQGPAGLPRPRFSKAFLLTHGRFGLSFQSVSIVALVRDQGLNVLIAAVAGLSTLGYWTIASRLLQAIVLLYESLWRVSYPAMARLVHAGEEATGMLRRGLTVASVAAGFVVVILAGCAPALVPTLFGEGWDPSADIIQWAALGALLAGPLSASGTGYLSAIGRVSIVVRAAIAQTLLLFAVGLSLVNTIGPGALGIGWLAGSAAQAVILAGGIRRHAAIRVVESLAAPFLSALIAALIAHQIAARVTPAPVALVVAGVAAEVVYLLLCCVFARDALRQGLTLLRRVARPPRASAVPASAQ